jgi:glutamate dehydrogenase (NAD(P)+)
VGLEAIVVVDNVTCGPAIGGIRIAPDLTIELDVAALIAHKQQGATVQTFPAGQPLGGDRLVGVDCDIWIPAARPDVLTAENVGQMQAKLVLQGANIPATKDAERWMQTHGILSIPDFIANAGGVICAAVEYHDGTQNQAFATIAEKIRANTAEMLAQMKQQQILPREAAVQMARVASRRRWPTAAPEPLLLQH